MNHSEQPHLNETHSLPLIASMHYFISQIAKSISKAKLISKVKPISAKPIPTKPIRQNLYTRVF